MQVTTRAHHDVDAMRATIGEIAETAPRLDKPDLQLVYAADHWLLGDAGILKRELTGLLVPHMEYRKPEVVRGLGTFELRRPQRQVTWDHERAARAVIDAALERGEIVHPHDVATVILECAGISYWRKGDETRGLTRLGLDVDAFRDRGWGDPTIQFRPFDH